MGGGGKHELQGLQAVGRKCLRWGEGRGAKSLPGSQEVLPTGQEKSDLSSPLVHYVTPAKFLLL